MQITTKDLYIAGSSVTVRVELDTGDGRSAMVDLSRQVITETWEIDLHAGLFLEWSSDYNAIEIEELIDYTKENSPELFLRAWKEAKDALENLPKD